MPVISILSAGDVADDDQIAPTRRSTPGDGGGIVPGGLAGYTHDGAAYCPECAGEVEATTTDGDTYTLDHFPAFHDDGSPVTDEHGFGVGIVSCTDEWDYPGATCHECGLILDTNILVYDEGGAHPHPVVRVRDPDRYRDPVTAFVLQQDDKDVQILLAEDFGSNGDAGTVSWIPRGDVIEGLDD